MHIPCYTLRIKQRSQVFEPTWDMLLLRPDDTLVYHAQKTCTRDVLHDGLVALSCAIPGLIVIYDEPRNDAAA